MHNISSEFWPSVYDSIVYLKKQVKQIHKKKKRYLWSEEAKTHRYPLLPTLSDSLVRSIYQQDPVELLPWAPFEDQIAPEFLLMEQTPQLQESLSFFSYTQSKCTPSFQAKHPTQTKHSFPQPYSITVAVLWRNWALMITWTWWGNKGWDFT